LIIILSFSNFQNKKCSKKIRVKARQKDRRVSSADSSKMDIRSWPYLVV